jgi:hypothetical protein
MFYGGISAETQPFFVANSVIFSHAFHTLYLLKFTHFGLYSACLGLLHTPQKMTGANLRQKLTSS